jgi:hypothetical protein
MAQDTYTIFGWQLSKKQKRSSDDVTDNPSFVAPDASDGSAIINAGGYFGTYLDVEGNIKNEADLIRRYREISMYADVDNAIEDIVNEAIVKDEDGAIVNINLEDLKEELSDNIREKIEDEFKGVLKLFNFHLKAHEIFRRWYIDGRLYYHKILNRDAPGDGVQELRFIDPRKIKKIREVKKEKNQKTGVDIVTSIEEYYIFNEKGLVATSPGQPGTLTAQGIRIAPEAITFVPSGYVDVDKNTVLSYLHKAIKPVNQLRMVEDSLVIYRLARAPERRVFYIDIGNLPKLKAEQYMKDIMAKYRNKMVYDANTGEIRDDKKYLSMLEDFWLPRREGGRGTEIDTLKGGDNLSSIEDIQYFQKKLYQSLNVPLSRLLQDQPFNFARGTEISRDEIKFSKFIDRMRNRFGELFYDVLKTQLLVKRIITEDDWKEIKDKIRFDFIQDIFYSELTDLEIKRNQVELVTEMQPFVGVYYSKEFVRRRILRQTDEEIEEMDKQMAKETTDLVNATGMGMGPDGAPGAPDQPPAVTNVPPQQPQPQQPQPQQQQQPQKQKPKE